MSEKLILRNKWVKDFTEACDRDSWGQMMEAVEGYERLAENMASAEKSMQLTHAERSYIGKLVACLHLRIKSLQDATPNALKLEQIKLLGEAITNCFMTNEFPLDLAQYNTTSLHASTRTNVGVEQDAVVTAPVDDHEAAGNVPKGTKLGPPKMTRGNKYLTISIDKIGLKDAETYIDPFVSVHVFDRSGDEIESSQDLEVCNKKRHNYVVIGQTVHIQSPINHFHEGTVIAFEFKHWKPKKRKNSTRCWTFLELDELKPGPCALELYKKPLDPKHKKKNINLFSIKPLYFHIDMRIDESF
eukprot:Rmarinus@m.6